MGKQILKNFEKKLNNKKKMFRKNENNFYKDIETADKKIQRFSNITSKVINFLRDGVKTRASQ